MRRIILSGASGLGLLALAHGAALAQASSDRMDGSSQTASPAGAAGASAAVPLAATLVPAPAQAGAGAAATADGGAGGDHKSYSAAGKDFQGSVAGGFTAKDLMGKNIVGPDGKEIAEVADLVIEPDNSIRRVIVDVGGFLGLGAKPVAIDIDQIQRPADLKADLRTSLTKEQLQALPRYTRDDKGNYVPAGDKG